MADASPEVDDPVADIEIDAAVFRQVLGQFPTGVAVITAVGVDGRPIGLAVGSFASVSLDPPLVAFMPDRRSTSWPKIRAAGKFCVNVLGDHQESVCRVFASKAPDKFEGLRWRAADSGCPILDGAVAWIDCDLERADEAGDHFIAVGRVRRLELGPPALPLLFFQGGYGSFVPMSTAIGGTVPLALLDLVDIARPKMDAYVSEHGGRCLAVRSVNEEVVLLANAGAVDGRRTPVGRRVPAVPPVAASEMAWEPEPKVEAWLRAFLPDESARADMRVRLEEVRMRGYSVALRGDEITGLEFSLHDEAVPRRRDLSNEDRENLHRLPLDPLGFGPQQANRVAAVHMPVFGRDGRACLVLSFEPPSPLAGVQEFERFVSRAREVAETIAEQVPSGS